MVPPGLAHHSAGSAGDGNPLDASGSGGDETVPTDSGQAPALAGVKASFRHGSKGKGQANTKRGYEHQESYNDARAQWAALYGVIKITQLADWHPNDKGGHDASRRLLAVLGVVVLTSMTSCTSFSSSRSSSMDKTGWITHCFGRFLIDLPPDAVINAGYYLWGDRIEYLDDKPTELAARVDRLEQEWRTQRHKSKGNMFLRKIDFGNESVGLLSWSSEVASKTYLLDTYVTSKPTWHAYRWKGKFR